MKKFPKFLKIGLVSIMAATTLVGALATNSLNASENYSNDFLGYMNHQVQQLKSNDLIPDVNVNFNIKAEDGDFASKAKLYVFDSACIVEMDVLDNMVAKELHHSSIIEEINEMVKPSSTVQELLKTEFVTYHELGHCQLYTVQNPFKADNAQIEQFLNKYATFTTNYHYDDIYNILHENFADTFAMVQLIRKHGATQDVLELAQKIQITRSVVAKNLNAENIIAHNTEFSLESLLKEDVIKEIISMDNSEIQDFVLDIANKGMWQSMATYEAYHNIDLEGVAYSIVHDAGLSYINSDVNESVLNNINLTYKSSAVYELSQEFRSVLESRHPQVKEPGFTLEALNEILKEDLSQLLDIAYEKLENKIQSEKESGQDFILDVMYSYLQQQTEKSSPIKSLEEIKEKGANDLENVKNIVNNLNPKENTTLLSFKKPSNLIDRIKDIRIMSTATKKDIKVNYG